MRKIQIQLANNVIVEGDYFDDADYEKIKEIFKKWQGLNADLTSLGGRALNVPDVVSEALYCYFFDAARTNAVAGAGSYDAINISNHHGVQVKSTSIENDLTSFGPTSTWDELYFMDFAPNGSVDGKIDFYKIDVDVKGIVLNASRGETFADQQAQDRRPRFSIKREIINRYGLKPVKSIDLLA